LQGKSSIEKIKSTLKGHRSTVVGPTPSAQRLKLEPKKSTLLESSRSGLDSSLNSTASSTISKFDTSSTASNVAADRRSPSSVAEQQPKRNLPSRMGSQAGGPSLVLDESTLSNVGSRASSSAIAVKQKSVAKNSSVI